MAELFHESPLSWCHLEPAIFKMVLLVWRIWIFKTELTGAYGVDVAKLFFKVAII